MGERTTYAPGTFSWVDLGTTDVAAAKAFYGGLFGWDAEDVPAPDATYTMFRLDGANVAGAFAQGPEEAAVGVPPNWLSHVTVPDADEAAARAAELGGTVVAPGVLEIPDSGRMAIVLDPVGAALSLWEPRRHAGAQRVNEPGCLCWNDLVCPDPAAVAPFYRALLDWTVEDVGGWRDEESAAGLYWTITTADGTANGGLLRLPGAPPAWVPYFAVEELDDAVARTQQLGGGVVVEPREVPAGRFATVRDPQGAVFSLFAGELDP
jgi:predicted enzyme related to lactoylglutathione lyase